ncbi:general secretion pathway protein GspB [Neiella sp. HB171785]|uniref:General secretion pathway protein GspB n=1 Tax=Neiella litorisoli TaxID=2771431 RepID=A0A8J6QJ48_9GAMM|nr:general secretion pathway protein GspB [Neiella litorisoli]MBD1389066.1 general secretion pathway protein GspB [Neiella litorisoli]
MSYILDALKRNASDAEVGDVPSLHTQAGVDKPAKRSRWLQPALAVVLVLATAILSYWLQPWNRQPAAAEVIIADAPEPEIKVLGTVDYSRFKPRSPVVLTPEPESDPVAQPLPQQPINAGIANGEQEALVEAPPATNDDQRLGGDELAALFRKAVQETEQVAPQQQNAAATAEVEPLTRKSQAFQNQVPTMEFSAHSYSSDPSKRMVKVNGSEIQEGDWINDSVQIVAILPNKVVMEMQGQRFSLPALSDW